MKPRIIKIFPLLISISLPGIGFFLSPDKALTTAPLIYQWSFTSTMLFTLWQLLSVSWKIKNPIKQIGFLLLCIPVFIIIVSFISYSIGLREHLSFDSKEIIRIIFLSAILLIIQFSRKSQKKVSELEFEKEQLSKENYKAHLQNIRNQMDPHFLFNSLNTLHSMVKQNNNKSEEFILNLADFYRSTLQYSEESTLTLSQELSILNSYLHLMKSRNEQAVKYKIFIDENVSKDLRLPSFALQSIVENCFKHNSMSLRNPLIIEVVVKSSYIQISNNVQERFDKKNSSGKGIELLQNRYNLLGTSEGLIVSNDGDNYVVKLKLMKPNECIDS